MRWEILALPYAVDAAKHLSAVRDVAADGALHRAWTVVHVSSDGVHQTLRTLAGADAWDFEALVLKPGDILHLVLMEDADGDGIGVRQEFAYGTRDDTSDLDGDGLSDRDEALLYGLNPQRGDTDLDGKRDSQEVFKAASMGVQAGAGVAVDGSLWAWGTLSLVKSPYTGPEHVDLGGARAASVAVCPGRLFVIMEDGALWGAGVNSSGELGAGAVLFTDTLVPIAAGTPFAAVACGALHTLGLTPDGTLYVWGADRLSALGMPGVIGQCQATLQFGCLRVPTQLGPPGGWAAIAAAESNSLGIGKDGKLWTWGDNGQGQLGRRTPAAADFPAQVGAETTWTAGAAGARHMVALKADGSLWSWGSNDRGQLGRDGGEACGGHDCSGVPGRVGTGNDWTFVAAGAANSAAVRTNQTLWTWGDNAAGQSAFGVVGGFFDRPGIVNDLRFRQLYFGGGSVLAIESGLPPARVGPQRRRAARRGRPEGPGGAHARRAVARGAPARCYLAGVERPHGATWQA
ncbi:MAG: hypothetical protein QM704_27140 [Anaeromyxobacteraceae bacterium]